MRKTHPYPKWPLKSRVLVLFFSQLRFMSTGTSDKLNFIFGRRSIRVYSPGEVENSTITHLLEAAMAAPSAMTKDPWRFVIVREHQMLSKLAATLAGGKMLATANVGILVCGDMDAVFDRQLSFVLQDCSAAIENLLLAAHALGLGGCWVGVHPIEEALNGVRRLLSLPATIVPVAVIALGHPGEQPSPRTRFNGEYVHFEKW
jgi:nitroreductase